MVSWRQFLHGYWAVYGRAPGDVFLNMAAPSGWRMELMLSAFGRGLYFVYPLSPGPYDEMSNHFL